MEFPTFEMTPLQERYTVRIIILLLFSRSIVINVHRPIPDLSFLLCNIANDILFKVNVVVPPGLKSEFHCKLNSDIYVVIFSFGHTPIWISCGYIDSLYWFLLNTQYILLLS